MADGKHDTADLLQAQAHVWNHIFNFINSMSLKCAIQLGIPDAIHKHGNGNGEPISLSQLVATLPLHPAKVHCIPRLMRILVQSGFFAKAKIHDGDEEEEEGYVLTSASKLLLKDNPLSVTPFVLANLDPSLTDPWHSLSTWFSNEDPTPFNTTHGMTFWECAGQRPKLNNFFNEAMASDARLVTSVLIDECKNVFEGLKSVVDVGGGTGTVSKSLAKAFPHLDCIVFDLPHVVSGLQDTHNLKYVGGDMFQAIPPADAVLLKWILHDWTNEECAKILGRCKESIKDKEGGKLIIIDMVMGNLKGDSDSVETQLFFDMVMMVLVTGQERNEKEWAKLFYDAGFSHYKITPLLGLRSLIEVYP